MLSLTGARLPRGDARRVILLDRELILGPGPTAHIRVDELSGPVVLHVRDGRLCCRSREAVRVDGRPAHPQAAIAMETRVEIGPVSMVVTPA